MVAGLRFVAHPGVNTGGQEPRRKRWAEQQVIDAQARIAGPVITKVIPERENLRIRMQLADRIAPALFEQALVARRDSGWSNAS